MDDLGLKAYAQNSAEVQSFVHWLWALSMVPQEKLDKYFKWTKEYIPNDNDEENVDVASHYNESIALFVTYFESNFIGIELSTRNGGRGKPGFVF